MVLFTRFRSIFWSNSLNWFIWFWISWFFWFTRFNRYWFCFLATRLTVSILEVYSCFVRYQLVSVSAQVAVSFKLSWDVQLDFFESFKSSEIFHCYSYCISFNFSFKNSSCIKTIYISYWCICDCQHRFKSICYCKLFVLINIFW